jgi:hypothetical protein
MRSRPAAQSGHDIVEMLGRDELVDNRRKDADTAALAVLGRLDRQRRRVDWRRGDQGAARSRPRREALVSQQRRKSSDVI